MSRKLIYILSFLMLLGVYIFALNTYIIPYSIKTVPLALVDNSKVYVNAYLNPIDYVLKQADTKYIQYVLSPDFEKQVKINKHFVCKNLNLRFLNIRGVCFSGIFGKNLVKLKDAEKQDKCIVYVNESLELICK